MFIRFQLPKSIDDRLALGKSAGALPVHSISALKYSARTTVALDPRRHRRSHTHTHSPNGLADLSIIIDCAPKSQFTSRIVMCMAVGRPIEEEERWF
ncbi:hypothetical protein J6590_010571 [Homalodisca vitripennis]|nr:hypothetical protein J6590_010571 [Homalodisca vitripennis]